MRSCLVDSEVIVCGDNGLSLFNLLRYRHYDHLATLCAFDLLQFDDMDVRPLPIEERKAALKKLLRSSIVFHHACKLGCEGIVSKRLGSSYRPGRSADWVKVKNPAAPAVKREAEEDWSTLGKRLR